MDKVIVHENFTFGELADDLALLRLSKPFCLNNFKFLISSGGALYAMERYNACSADTADARNIMKK